MRCRTALIPSAVFLSLSLANPCAYASLNGATRADRHVTVAVVPYAETLSPGVDKVVKDIESKLRGQKGVRVLDRKTTNDILVYYLGHVDSNTDESAASVSLRQAREAYQAADYDLASRRLAEAESQIKGGKRTVATNGTMPDLLILKAKLAYVLGNKASVPSIYEELVRLNPDIEFAKGLYSRWEHSALADAKKKQAALRTASILIYSDPKNCEVYVNGIHKGVTYYDKPFEVSSFPPGEHCVELRTINYQTHVECFVLSEGETREIRATLRRIGTNRGSQAAVVAPSRFGTANELSVLVSGLGYYMGADKVILVHDRNGDLPDMLQYQIGDAALGAVNKPSVVEYNSRQGAPLALVTKEMRSEIHRDVLANPEDQLISQSVGSIQLHEQRRKPIYKRPVFWVVVGAGAAAGGITAAILGGGAIAAATGGILIGL